MTTRDEIAARVAGGLAGVALEAEWIAKRSYDIADALIREAGIEPDPAPKPEPAPAPKPAAKRKKNGKLADTILEVLQSEGRPMTMREIQAKAGLKSNSVWYAIKGLVAKGKVSKSDHERNATYCIAGRVSQPVAPPPPPPPPDGDLYAQKLHFAKTKGFKSYAAAIAAWGKNTFEREFNAQTR